ncbi:DMT family transporter [Brevundimonas variabilis]|uniref:Small multidrug resistance pump n=1 Tax=Brevundimonas variabilis TaxID=74312 RepID=A0A7W9CHU9_9CAUL|nr:multidrug efflux SMR transporter [Brevundimonas variabilis]MBB5745517.1 small multidrug resistance pump [Brevundimonas variabilis]
MNVWIVLTACIALEIVATSLLKASEGFSRPWLGMASMVCYSGCFWLLSAVLTRLPVGVAYAVWSGVGIVGITLVGVFLFRQSLTLMQMGFIALILIGAVGLQLSTRTADMA